MFLSCFLFLSFFFFFFLSLWVFFGGGGGCMYGGCFLLLIFFFGGWGGVVVDVVFVFKTCRGCLRRCNNLSSSSLCSAFVVFVVAAVVANGKVNGGGGVEDMWDKACSGNNSVVTNKERLCSQAWLSFVGCLTSQKQASVSQGRICSDNFTCCHTERAFADQTSQLTQSQYTDTGPTSPSADPITLGAWQASYWSANL